MRIRQARRRQNRNICTQARLDEAAVTIECQARDAAAAAEAARALIGRTARLTGQIGIRDREDRAPFG